MSVSVLPWEPRDVSRGLRPARPVPGWASGQGPGVMLRVRGQKLQLAACCLHLGNKLNIDDVTLYNLVVCAWVLRFFVFCFSEWGFVFFKDNLKRLLKSQLPLYSLPRGVWVNITLGGHGSVQGRSHFPKHSQNGNFAEEPWWYLDLCEVINSLNNFPFK